MKFSEFKQVKESTDKKLMKIYNTSDSSLNRKIQGFVVNIPIAGIHYVHGDIKSSCIEFKVTDDEQEEISDFLYSLKSKKSIKIEIDGVKNIIEY